MQYESGDSSLGTLATKEKIKAFSIAADIPLGAITGKVGYLIYNSDKAGQDAKKFGLGGEYAFSKRTALYSDVSKASGDRLTDAAKKAQFDIGLRHKF
jgi:predicted porin